MSAVTNVSRAIMVRAAAATLAVAAIVAVVSVVASPAPDQTDEHAVVEHPELSGRRLVSRNVFDSPGQAPGFRLIDGTGEPLVLDDLRGSVVALGFGYTRCPDVCPLLFAQYLEIQRKVAGVADGSVVLLLVTMDPEWDTPERLASLTRSLNAKWHYLSGDRSNLERVWEQYDIFVTENDQDVIQHDYKVYLIDRDGNLRIQYGGLVATDDMISDINALLEG